MVRIPSEVIMKDRQVVDTTTPIWSFRASADGGRSIHLNWKLFYRHASSMRLDQSVTDLAQAYLAAKMRYSKGSSVRNDFVALCKLLRFMASRQRTESSEFTWQSLTDEDFRLFLDAGYITSSKGNDFAHVRDFYCWCAFVAQIRGFDTQLALAIKQLRAKGNVKGAAVRFMDPVKGPLHIGDREPLIAALISGKGDVRDRCLVMLHLELGPNPNAAARMRNSDLRRFTVNTVVDGKSKPLTRYQIAVPRVKKRTEHRQTKLRPISRELGELLESIKAGTQDDPLFYWLDPFSPESDISKAMQRFVAEAGVTSLRTGHLLHLTPRRFRYTLATEAARDGASPAKIAELLDHSDLQNVKVYIEASAQVVEQVGDAFDQMFGAVALHFKGKVIEETSAPHAVIPSAAPQLPLLNVGGIGVCGRDVRRDGLCNLAPPLSCYACEFFAAFRNGPHVEVLHSLEAIQAEMKGTVDARIPAQLAGVVHAARELVKQIASESDE